MTFYTKEHYIALKASVYKKKQHLYLPLKKDGRLSKPKCQAGLVSTLRWRTAVLIIKIGAKVRQ